MDVRLDTLSDWAVESLCQTFFVPPLSSLGDIPALPLPSVAEILLGDPSSSVCLPSPIANRIIDGLARRGRLTANVLDILLDRNRSRLTALPLYCLADIDPEAVVGKIAKLIDVTNIDISFSPCWADLSTPFLKIVKGNCKDSLTSFCARYVVGEIGLLELPHFSSLKHLDIGFTSIAREELRIFVSNLPLLEHLCISGIPVSLFEVFSMADCLTCVGLKHLGLNSLKFLSVAESEFTAALSSKISAFFSKLRYLGSVDLSYVSWCGDRKSGKASVIHAVHEILTSSSSLTHLDISGTISTKDVCDVLTAAIAGQLKFLRNFGYVYPYNVKRVENFDPFQQRLRALNCEIALGHNVSDFRTKDALGNFECFFEAVKLAQLTCSDLDAIPPHLCSMIFAGLLRMRTDSKVEKVIANFFDKVDEQIAKNDTSPVLSRRACRLLELAFQHFLDPSTLPLLRDYRNSMVNVIRFLPALLSNVYHFARFICSDPILSHLAVAVICSLPEASDYKYHTLRKLFEKLPAISRRHLAIDKSYLDKLCAYLSDLVDSYSRIEAVRRNMFSFDTFVRHSYATVRGLSSLCYGLQNLFRCLVKVPRAVDNLAEVALRCSYYCDNINPDSDPCLFFHGLNAIDLFWAAVECLSYIAEIRVLAHEVCLGKVIKAIVDISSPTPRQRFAVLYLAGLLIANDELDSIWPHDVKAKDALVTELFGNSDNEDGFCKRTRSSFYLYTTLMPLVKICNCSKFPAVAAFGLNHLAYFCSHFDAQKYYTETGLCPLCLMRKEVGADVIFGLPIPAELKVKFDAVMKACPVHKDE